LPEPVNELARRSLRDNTGDAADGHRNADVLRIPVVTCREVNGQERPDAARHIGEKHVQEFKGSHASPARLSVHIVHACLPQVLAVT